MHCGGVDSPEGTIHREGCVGLVVGGAGGEEHGGRPWRPVRCGAKVQCGALPPDCALRDP